MAKDRARGFADRARSSRLGQRAQELARHATTRASEVWDDPDQRARVAAGVFAMRPLIDSGLDAARVRNKHGEVTKWRVARAAVRPQLTMRNVTKAIIGELGPQLRGAGGEAPSPASSGLGNGGRAGTIFPTLLDVEAEWPLGALEDDLLTWTTGMHLFESLDRDGPDAAHRAGGLICQGLKHQLMRNDFVFAVDQVDAQTALLHSLWNASAIALHYNDEHSWSAEQARRFRLVLTLIRRFELQPARYGGRGTFDEVFDGEWTWSVACHSLSPTPDEFDLDGWFRQPWDAVDISHPGRQ